MQNSLRRSLIVTAIMAVAVMLIPAGLWWAVLGCAAVGIYSGVSAIRSLGNLISSDLKGDRNPDGTHVGLVSRLVDRINQKHELKRQEGVFCSPDNGVWNMKNMPYSMNITIQDGENSTFSVLGSSKQISTERVANGLMSFGFDIGSIEEVDKLNSIIKERGFEGITIEKDAVHWFKLSGYNPEVVAELARICYPPVTYKVERTVSTVNQYVISASSYEEAVRLLEESKRNGKRMTPANSFVNVSDDVEGRVLDRTVSGMPLHSVCVPFGSYVVNETVRSVMKQDVELSGVPYKNISSDQYREASDAFDASKAVYDTAASNEEPVLSDGLDGQRKNRTMHLDNGRIVEFCEGIKDFDRNLYVILRCSSIKDYQELVSGRKSLDGHMVHIDDDIPTPSSGEYIVAVPVKDEFLHNLHSLDNSVDNLVERYPGHITEEEANISILNDEIRRNGYSSACLQGDIDFSGAMINGVPGCDFSDRLSASDCPSLKTAAQVDDWLEDAKHIVNIDMNLDTKHNELLFKTEIKTGNHTEVKISRRSLSSDEMYELSGRVGSISEGQMKDLAIRMYPEYFKSYHDKSGALKYISGNGAFDAFLSGRTPETIPAYTKRTGKTVENKPDENINLKGRTSKKNSNLNI